MSITKKGSRRIVVDGTVYRWMIRRKPSRGQADYAEPLTFAVAQENIRGSLLHVKMNAARYDIMHDVPHSVVSPKTVAAAIRKALTAGWQPGYGGGTFCIVWSETLPDI